MSFLKVGIVFKIARGQRFDDHTINHDRHVLRRSKGGMHVLLDKEYANAIGRQLSNKVDHI